MARLARWIALLPTVFVASVLAGALVYYLLKFITCAWYLWAMSGTASGVAFLIVAFAVAPQDSVRAKWVAVIVVGLLGAMSALGSLLVGEEPERSIAGAAMLACAYSFGWNLHSERGKASVPSLPKSP
jgi:hypothetical protein